MSCDWFCSSTDRQQVQLSVPQTVPDGSEGGDPDERYQLSEEGSGGGVRGGARGGAGGGVRDRTDVSAHLRCVTPVLVHKHSLTQLAQN